MSGFAPGIVGGKRLKGLSSVPGSTQVLTVASNRQIESLSYSALLTAIGGLSAADLSTHAALPTTHGVVGAIVGTTDVQTLTNKTLTLPTIAAFTNAGHSHQNAAGGGQLDHGLALSGLTDDDHSIYALLAGRSGGQTFIGGTAASNNLTLQSTSHATRGYVKSNDPVRVYDSGGTKYAGVRHDGTYSVVESSSGHMSLVSPTGDFYFGTTVGGFGTAILQAASARLYLGSSITSIQMSGTSINYNSGVSAGTFQTFIHGNTINSIFQNVATCGLTGLWGTYGTLNTAGSDLTLEGGRGNGSGAGGSLLFATSPPGSSGTTTNTQVVCGKFDTNTTANESRFLLYDITAASLKRVSFGSNDSGGSGYKLLRVAN